MKHQFHKRRALCLAAALLLCLTGCGGKRAAIEAPKPAPTAAQAAEAAPVPTTPTVTPEPAPTAGPAANAPAAESAPDASPTGAPAAADGMRPEFKQSMDDYEAFFDEYCAFMQKYKDADDPVSMLADYAAFLSRYADAMEGMDALDDADDLNNAELKYYIEVTARIQQKLLDAAA